VFDERVFKCKESTVELFEDRAYRCGISLEKELEEEECSESNSLSSHCQPRMCSHTLNKGVYSSVLKLYLMLCSCGCDAYVEGIPPAKLCLVTFL